MGSEIWWVSGKYSTNQQDTFLIISCSYQRFDHWASRLVATNYIIERVKPTALVSKNTHVTRIPYWMRSTARASYEKRRSRRWQSRSLLLYHAVWSGRCLPTLRKSLLPCEGRRLIWNASKLTTNYTASSIPLLLRTNVLQADYALL